MKIEKLKLKNFRSYKDAEIAFADSVLIVGENAQGKTNLLESIYLATVGKNLKGKEADLVCWGNEYFRIEIEVSVKDSGKRRTEYIFEKNIPRKTVKVNGVKKGARGILEGADLVFFSPEEIDMFFLFPSARRRYFNLLFSKTFKEYATNLVRYSKALDQRNALLKQIFSGKAKAEDLEIWDGKIAEYGSNIIEMRKKGIREINDHLQPHYKEISGENKQVSLSYESGVCPQKTEDKEEIWAHYLERLLKSRQKDTAYGVTTVGPHRDDYLFSLAEKSAAFFASRGESRSLILALKFAEADFLNETFGEQPVLLLDDVFSELDEKRRNYLVGNFRGRQVIVTTTDMDHVEKSLRKNAQVYIVKNSVLEKIHE